LTIWYWLTLFGNPVGLTNTQYRHSEVTSINERPPELNQVFFCKTATGQGDYVNAEC